MIMNILEVRDNGENHIDRYSIVFNDLNRIDGRLYYSTLCLSDKPDLEKGYCQWSFGLRGTHLGKAISFDRLPRRVRNYVKERLDSEKLILGNLKNRRSAFNKRG